MACYWPCRVIAIVQNFVSVEFLDVWLGPLQDLGVNLQGFGQGGGGRLSMGEVFFLFEYYDELVLVGFLRNPWDDGMGQFPCGIIYRYRQRQHSVCQFTLVY